MAYQKVEKKTFFKSNLFTKKHFPQEGMEWYEIVKQKNCNPHAPEMDRWEHRTKLIRSMRQASWKRLTVTDTVAGPPKFSDVQCSCLPHTVF